MFYVWHAKLCTVLILYSYCIIQQCCTPLSFTALHCTGVLYCTELQYTTLHFLLYHLNWQPVSRPWWICWSGINYGDRCLHIWHKPVKQMFAHLAQTSKADVCTFGTSQCSSCLSKQDPNYDCVRGGVAYFWLSHLVVRMCAVEGAARLYHTPSYKSCIKQVFFLFF